MLFKTMLSPRLTSLASRSTATCDHDVRLRRATGGGDGYESCAGVPGWPPHNIKTDGKSMESRRPAAQPLPQSLLAEERGKIMSFAHQDLRENYFWSTENFLLARTNLWRKRADPGFFQ